LDIERVGDREIDTGSEILRKKERFRFSERVREIVGKKDRKREIEIESERLRKKERLG
jgi:hypothetical protein